MKLIHGCILLSMAIAFGDDAVAKTYVCPERVEIERGTVDLVNLPAGFAGKIQPGVMRLSAAGVSDGPPDELAELKPYSIAKGSSRVTWKELDSSIKGVWLACYYGDRTISVSIQAEGRPSECVAVYQESAASRSLRAHFECH